jgi:hypothetical protein
MNESEWIAEVKSLLKAELKRKNVTYDQLAIKLRAIGVDETTENINNKINRGKFSAIFLLQCMKVLGMQMEACLHSYINTPLNNKARPKETIKGSAANVDNLTIPFAKLEARAEMLAEENDRLKKELEQCRVEAKNTRDLYTSASAVLRVTEEQVDILQQEKKLLLEKLGGKY